MHRSLKVLRVSGWVVGGGYTLCLRTWMISFFFFSFLFPFLSDTVYYGFWKLMGNGNTRSGLGLILVGVRRRRRRLGRGGLFRAGGYDSDSYRRMN